jgi:hypothetical protein
MTTLWGMFFPQLADKKWVYAHLDSHAEMLPVDGENKLLNPLVQDQWIQQLTSKLGADHLWGGYLENRNHLLRGHYMKEGEHWHVGLDFWVPAGTPLFAGLNAELVHSEMDPDYHGGWGGKLIFKVRDDLYYILGHLDKIVTEKRLYQSNEQVAVIGDYPINGNFAAHLHLQCCSNLDIAVDGYHAWNENLRTRFPHPISLSYQHTLE